jgi:ATP-binding cassette subfamily B protein
MTLKTILRAQPGANALLAALGLAGAAGALLLPAAVAAVVDAQLAGDGGAPALAALGAVLVLLVTADMLSQVTAARSTSVTTAGLRRGLLSHLLALGAGGQRRFQTGDVVSRLVSSAPEAAAVVPALTGGLSSMLVATGGVAALALIDPWLAGAFLLGVPVGLLLIRTFVTEVGDLVARYQRSYGAVAARLSDALAGIRTINACGTQQRETARVLVPATGLRDLGHRMWRTQGRVGWQAGLLAPAMQIIVLAVAGWLLSGGRITPGQLLAAAGYVPLALGFFAQAGVFLAVARARANLRRLQEVHEAPAMSAGAGCLPAGPGELVLRAVTVRDDGHPVLDAVDLTVPAGRSVAVVGRSGTGKSVLAAAAGRLIEPDGGEVLLDGVPLGDLSLRVLRAEVSYAFERPVLLGDTVADALAMGRPGAPRHDVERAARLVRADAFVARLPSGYDTPLVRAPMSGGEAQRLGLARAVTQGGRLMILDDATSNLDTITEREVSGALVEALRGRTRLIVAHRATTAARADLVAWLDGGRVRALDAHDALWADPDYRRVFEPEPV